MPTGLEEFGQIIVLIGGALGSIWTIIKLSEWWGKKGKKGEEGPDLILEWHEESTYQTGGLDVEIYSLNIKNSGNISAEDVEVRLYDVEQNDTSYMQRGDRYILHRSKTVKAGDSFPFTFIHDMRDANLLITPAENDRTFTRTDSVFTFHIIGSNIEPVIQKMIMKLDEASNRFRILPL